MSTHDAPVAFLKTVACFAVLKPAALTAIASRSRLKSFRKGEPIFTEGEPCHYVYILEAGQTKCYRTSAEGHEQILRIFDRPGDVFCIPSVFSTGRHIVSANAMTSTRLYLIDRETMIRVAGEHPSVAMNLIAMAGEHMKGLVALAGNLSLKTATARLAKLLYDLATREAIQNSKKVQLVRARLREEELASIIGTVRVNVSRSLKNLAGAGAIRLSRRSIEIRDLSVLEQLSEETTL